MFFTEDEVKSFRNIVNNFEKFELHLDLLYKGTIRMTAKHDTLKK